MRRGRSTGKPTASQLERWDKIRDPDTGTGCIVAHILGIGWLQATIHHLTIGGRHGQKRRGHDETIGLNEWSHLGKPLDGWTAELCEAELGPSYAHDPNGFRERFGDDDYLLQLQNDLIDGK